MKTGSSRKLMFVASAASVAMFAPSALAQFNIQWLTLTQNTTKLKTPVGTNADIVGNGDEKDFAVGDVNKDGWDDLAVGKKIQVSFPGKREGRFFLNEKGTLVDRTAQYASASTTAGDNGFKEPLDCRDVEFADFNGDGWLDMVGTQTDLSNDTSAAAKRTTHPRIYMNLGSDVNGNWLGFRHEDNRIPQLKTIPGNINGIVRFCDGAVGDVDLDGDIDLYFVDYDTDENGHAEPSANDLNDRLLLNNGSGFFTDATNTSFNNTGMWSSAFGTECEFQDLNGDGKLDIVKISTLTDSPNRNEVIYNNISPTTTPNFTGGFDNIQTISPGENYTMAHADINNDGRLDHLVGDDATDHYLFNTGNNALGQVVWSALKNFTWLTGSGEDGFPGQMYSRDYNLDGWMDCLITDVDIDLPGCNRRTKIYHNRGGTPGSTTIVLAEEKQQSGTGGWFGAVGWSTNNPKGVNDAANIDFDRDGDTDIILGMCTGTQVWMNETNPVICQPQVFPASNGNLNLSVCGQPLWSNLAATMNITNGPASGTAVLLTTLPGATATPAFGGTIYLPVIAPIVLTLPLNGSGATSLPVAGGAGPVGGVTVWLYAIAGYPIEISNVIALTMFN
jgi:FG-GAP-like repeat